jgi:hypothetical protein
VCTNAHLATEGSNSLGSVRRWRWACVSRSRATDRASSDWEARWRRDRSVEAPADAARRALPPGDQWSGSTSSTGCPRARASLAASAGVQGQRLQRHRHVFTLTPPSVPRPPTPPESRYSRRVRARPSRSRTGRPAMREEVRTPDPLMPQAVACADKLAKSTATDAVHMPGPTGFANVNFERHDATRQLECPSHARMLCHPGDNAVESPVAHRRA